MSFQLFDIWENMPMSLPRRSQLYQLTPRGLNSAFVECITSYLLRLAHAHLVSPGIIVARDIAPLFQRKTMLLKNGQCDLLNHRLNCSLNGHGQTAKELVAVLTGLTGDSHLQCTTMLRFRGIISERQLLRKFQAWCPLCLWQFKHSDQEYYPLLWCLLDLKACPIHGISMIDRCPKCQKHQAPLHYRATVGRCLHCRIPLAAAESGLGLTDAHEHQRARYIQTLFESPPPEGESEARRFQQNVTFLLVHACENNQTRFCELTGTNRSSLVDWCQGLTLPSLRSVLGICESFQISPRQLFGTFTAETPISRTSSRYRRRELRHHDYAAIESKLRRIIASDEFPPRSFTRICSDLHCDQTSVKRRFPELATQLRKTYRSYTGVRKQARIQTLTVFIRLAVKSIYDAGEYPSAKRVSSDVPSFVSFTEPLVRDIWRKALLDFGIKK